MGNSNNREVGKTKGNPKEGTQNKEIDTNDDARTEAGNNDKNNKVKNDNGDNRTSKTDDESCILDEKCLSQSNTPESFSSDPLRSAGLEHEKEERQSQQSREDDESAEKALVCDNDSSSTQVLNEENTESSLPENIKFSNKTSNPLNYIEQSDKGKSQGKKNLKKMKKEVLCQDDICFTIVPIAKDIAEYCVPLLQVRFSGQTNSKSSQSDTSDTKDVLNLGLYLKLVDKFLHQFNEVSEFTGNEEEYRRLLKLVALKRKQKDETTNQCFQRILADSNRFVRIYHKRGVVSQRLEHKKFWGSRQQMLAGKVIADWIDPEGGPLDPIFGVILHPTAGRAGPGDSCWIHSFLFDDVGHMAYHSAVHDAFGYLLNCHGIGPGYNYLHNSLISEKNPLSGQKSGVSFWKEVIGEVEKKQKVLSCVEL